MILFDNSVIKLRQKYLDSNEYENLSILKEIILISFNNNVSIPREFDIPVKYCHKYNVITVLKDLGIDCQGIDIHCGIDSAYVKCNT